MRHGIIWYSREDYSAIRALMADGAGWPADYDVWEAKARAQLDALGRSHGAATRVEVTAAYFGAWCFKYGLRCDAAARDRFVAAALWEPPRRSLAGRLAGWLAPQPPSPAGPRITGGDR